MWLPLLLSFCSCQPLLMLKSHHFSFKKKTTAAAALRQVSLAKARLQVTSCIPSSCSSGQLHLHGGKLNSLEKKRSLSEVVEMDERGFTRKVNLARPSWT